MSMHVPTMPPPFKWKNLTTTRPKAMYDTVVRVHARNVRSLARWSRASELLFGVILLRKHGPPPTQHEHTMRVCVCSSFAQSSLSVVVSWSNQPVEW